MSGIPFLRFEFDLMRFNSEELDVTVNYHRFEREFGPTPRSIFFIPKTKNHAFHTLTLQKLDSFTDTISRIEGVDEVSSIENFRLPVYIGFGYVAERLVQNEKISAADSTLIRELPFAPFAMYTKEARYPVVTITLSDEIDLEKINSILENIQIIGDQMFSEHHIMGRQWAEFQYNQMLKEETVKGIIAAILIVIFMLWILFRKLGSIVLPALAIITGFFTFFGMKGWAGWSMDILGTLFPPLLLIVGLSDVVHLYAKIQWHLSNGSTLKRAVRASWKETGSATFLTSLTTAIGFMSLLTTDVVPIRNFGVEAGWGVLIMFVSCIVVMPLFLRLAIKKRSLRPIPAGTKNWNTIAAKMTRTSKNIWLVPVLFTLLAFGAIYFGLQIHTSVKNYWQIQPDSTLGNDIQFFEAEDGGLRSLDIGIHALEGDMHMDSPENMRVVAEITKRIRANATFGSVLSSSDMLCVLNMASFGGLPSQFQMGTSIYKIEKDMNWWIENDPNSYHKMISESGEIARIVVRLANVHSDSAAALQDWIESEVESISPRHTAIFTGNSLIMDTMNDRLVENMLSSLLLAFVIIAVLMGALFRSARMLVISLIPNTFPLVVAIGAIGALHIPVGTSVAMVLTIAFVIAVDDTIHYLMRFRHQVDKVRTVEEAVLNTSAQTGRAMVLSSSVMLAAFIPLFFSNFLEELYFAIILTIVVISALLADLYVLPWLLLRFFKK